MPSYAKTVDEYSSFGGLLLQAPETLRAACLQNETAPEKCLNRYEKRFEKREKGSEKTIRNAFEKCLAPLRPLKNTIRNSRITFHHFILRELFPVIISSLFHIKKFWPNYFS